MRILLRTSFIGAATWLASTFLPAAASACGGFFCNRAQPVNQAAEGIIFADNGDGTTTAVIQIQYQGPSQNFSWLLPLSSVPKSDDDIGIASNLALQRLQSATNPSYALTVKVEGSCRQESSGAGCGASSASGSAAPAARGTHVDPDNGGVTVEASGVVGSFEWTVISLDKTLADPADAAVQWLTMNGYDVPSSAPALLAPYLATGLNLLALRLTKGADSGSIRPIVLTYEGTQPSIPIKLTAVAANDDMGVLTWVLGKSRAVPQNYLSLELNEARINWFNAASNYNSVVTAAANDAGGQGFVTEFAGSTRTLSGLIWTQLDDSNWRSLNTLSESDNALFNLAYQRFGQWDGFWDATRAVAQPSGVTFDAFKLCPTCYPVKLETAAYLAALDKQVIKPVKRVQDLIDAHPEITRLYTTLSADEMTLDPLFTFNADLPDVSNAHTADRVIACNPGVTQFEAAWRIDLPQGGVIWGTANDANAASWPAGLSVLPPNRLISQVSDTGSGRVLEDNSAAILSQLDTYNAGKSAAPGSDGCATGRGRRSSSAVFAAALLAAAAIRRRRRVQRGFNQRERRQRA